METKLPQQFQKYFWEYNNVPLDIIKNEKLIIERILCFGNVNSVSWLLHNTTKNSIKETILRSKNIDKKTYNYWITLLND